MNTRLAIAWIFLAGALISVAMVVQLYVRHFAEADIVAYLKGIGSLYSVPLGIIVASMFGAVIPTLTLSKSTAAYAVTCAIAWNAFPIAVGAYGAFTDAGMFVQLSGHLTDAAIPVNAAITGILSSLFPKPRTPGDDQNAARSGTAATASTPNATPPLQ